MRLRPEKIEHLAGLILDSLSANADVKIQGERAAVIGEVGKIITEDLQTEEEIETEARKLLDAHQDEMRRTNIRYDQALRKTKQKIARDRGFVL